MTTPRARRVTRELTPEEQDRLRRYREQIASELPDLAERDRMRKEAREEATLSGELRRAVHGSPLSLSTIAGRTGIPPLFGSWAELANLVDTLVRTNCIPDGTKLWWDVRPNWKYPTLEFRVCDVCPRVDEAVCIAALFQALIAKLWKLRRDNLTFRLYPLSLIEENKWRAVRYGLDGKLLDLGKQIEVPTRELIHELIEWFLADVIDELGTHKEIEYAFEILRNGGSAARQVATFNRTGDLKDVVDQLIAETGEGVAEPGGPL